VLGKCLAAHPDDRYQSAGDLAADLQAWLEGRPRVHAADNSVPTRVFSFARRHPKSCALAGIVFVACIGGLLAARSVSQARIESCWEKVEQAKSALLSGDTTTASTLIGETRGMIRTPPLLLYRTSGREIASQLQRLEGEIRKTQFNARADVVRLTFASSSPAETMDASKRLLENYGVYRAEDWESRSPFAELDSSSRRIVAEGITEIMLIALLQTQDSVSQADMLRLVRRLPLRYRGLPVFGAATGERPAAGPTSKTQGDSFEAHLEGLVAFHQKRFGDAHDWFDRSETWRERTNPPRFWTSFWNARACEELNRIRLAIGLYGTCIGQRPGFSWPRYNLARLLADDGQLDPAMHYIDSAIRVDERFAPAYVLRSAILVKQGRYRDAINVCQDAVRYGDASADLYKNRAAAHAGLNEFERAYEDLLQAHRIAPDDQHVESDLARIKGLLGASGRR
jgi:tetratricopeptide (TPR) repeat protein